MECNKVSGPDDFHAEFFQKLCPLISNDPSELFRDFLIGIWIFGDSVMILLRCCLRGNGLILSICLGLFV